MLTIGNGISAASQLLPWKYRRFLLNDGKGIHPYLGNSSLLKEAIFRESKKVGSSRTNLCGERIVLFVYFEYIYCLKFVWRSVY